jgi:hypothetical protein
MLRVETPFITGHPCIAYLDIPVQSFDNEMYSVVYIMRLTIHKIWFDTELSCNLVYLLVPMDASRFLAWDSNFAIRWRQTNKCWEFDILTDIVLNIVPVVKCTKGQFWYCTEYSTCCQVYKRTILLMLELETQDNFIDVGSSFSFWKSEVRGPSISLKSIRSNIENWELIY